IWTVADFWSVRRLSGRRTQDPVEVLDPPVKVKALSCHRFAAGFCTTAGPNSPATALGTVALSAGAEVKSYAAIGASAAAFAAGATTALRPKVSAAADSAAQAFGQRLIDENWLFKVFSFLLRKGLSPGTMCLQE